MSIPKENVKPNRSQVRSVFAFCSSHSKEAAQLQNILQNHHETGLLNV